jgi:D-alanyl-D-alanine dipeptidase
VQLVTCSAGQKKPTKKKLSVDDLSDFQKKTFQDPQLFERGILKTQKLLPLGYLSPLSNHSRGSTVDLELQFYEEVESNWKDLDMGTRFDTFSQSAAHSADLGHVINERRRQLKQLMNQYGFSALAKEWWHWTHQASNDNPVLDGEIR